MPGRRRVPPLSLLAVAVALAAGVAAVVAHLDEPLVAFGDRALIELSTRRALEGEQLLGAYSRFGWHHPGPLAFYLSAPFLWATGGAARALSLAALAVNGAAALAVVWAVRRRAGEVAARWAAVVVLAYLLLVGVDRVWDPWNPHVILVPVALTVVLAAGAASGSWWSLVGAAAAGSLVVQGHVAPVPSVGAVLLVAAVGWWRHREPAGVAGRGGPWSRAGRVVAVAALLAMWVPVAVEQVTGRPGNLTELARFAVDGADEDVRVHGHTLGEAAGEVASHVAVLPLGHEPAPVSPPSGPARLAVAALVAAGAVAVAALAHRRGERWTRDLALLALLALALAVVTAARTDGTYKPYLLLWTSGLAVPAWVAVGALAVKARAPATLGAGAAGVAPAGSRALGPLAAAGRHLPAGAAAGLAGVLVAAFLAGDGAATRSADEVAAAVDVAERVVADHDAEEVVVELTEDRFYLATGLVLGLDKAGVDVRVAEPWTETFGLPEPSRGGGDVTLVLARPGDPQARDQVAGARPVGWVRRAPVGDVTGVWARVEDEVRRPT